MLKRLAFFEGAIRPGREAAFEAYVTEKLVPLWTRFPGALNVEVLREIEAEDGSHRYPMALAITYADASAIAAALASPVRMESREVTKGLYEFFDGRIFHVVYRFDAYAPAAA
jgi:antibiotic biosynthesis monooxygenase (ABM) superfamily enzyme